MMGMGAVNVRGCKNCQGRCQDYPEAAPTNPFGTFLPGIAKMSNPLDFGVGLVAIVELLTFASIDARNP
jgi:hypothetical protein